MPTKNAMAIIIHSNKILCTMEIPNKLNAGKRNGSRPQCIAHKIDVTIPNLSQFNFIFIKPKDK